MDDPLKQTQMCELDRDNSAGKHMQTDWEARQADMDLDWELRKLRELAKAMLDNDPNDMAADGVTCLDVLRKESRQLFKD